MPRKGSKKKDSGYYKNRRKKVRLKKRALTSSAGSMTAEQVKNEKQSLKREYRGLKRSEKHQVGMEIKDEIELDEDIESEEQFERERLFRPIEGDALDASDEGLDEDDDININGIEEDFYER